MSLERSSWPLALSLFLSGASALAYQVVWVRQLTLVFGTTLAAVATVLGVFMAGLGLGGALAARYVDRRSTSSLPRIYAFLEIGIGAFAVVFPLLLTWVSPLYRAAPGSLVRVATAALLLLVPTTLMGATLPTLTALRERIPHPSGGAGRSAGVLYAANTLGAVAGSLSTALVLLPSMGIRLSTFGFAALNGLAAGIVGLAYRSGESEPRARDEVATEGSGSSAIPLAVVALSGFAALVSEVAWTRSLVLLIGPTTYGFSFVVSSVIFGLAAGSAVGARFAARPRARDLSWAQLGAALSSVVVMQSLGRLVLPVGGLVHAHAGDMGALLGIELLGIALLLLPASFFFGATFPLAVASIASAGRAPGAASGLALAWNTAGALAGSLAAGFLLVPAVGAEGALFVSAGVHLAAATLPELHPERRLALPLASAFMLGSLFFLPRWDKELLTGGLYKYAPYMEPGEFLDFLRQGELLYYREDEVATVTVKKVATRLSLAIDGKVDATNTEDMLTQRMLAHVPLLLHPEPRRVLVIGLGSGVTASSALTHEIESLEAVEISNGVVEASKLFEDVNHEPGSDPRFRLVVGDARNHLLLSEESFDVVISEPSNPWMAGVSSLFTRDFFVLARSRLQPGGLFCQWTHVYNLKEEDLKTIVGSFTDAFEHTALFLLSESDALLVGARDSFPKPKAEAVLERMAREEVRNDLESVGVRGLYGLDALYAASTPALSDWAKDAERHTDDRPLLEFRAARAIHRDTTRENREALLSLGRRSLSSSGVEPSGEDLLARAESLEGAESFEWAFETYSRAVEKDRGLLSAYEGLVRTAIASGRLTAAEEFLERRPAGVEPLLGLAMLYRSLGRLDGAVIAVSNALGLDPERRDALVLAAEVAGDRGETDAMAGFSRRALALDPLDAEAASLLAESSLREGDFATAAQASASILAVRPSEPRALQVHAIAHAELGNTNLARDSFEKLLSLEPDDWIQRNNLGRLELSAGHSERAAQLFEEAVDRNPRNLVGYRGLEEAALAIGDAPRLDRARSMLRFLEARPAGAQRPR